MGLTERECFYLMVELARRRGWIIRDGVLSAELPGQLKTVVHNL